MDVLRWGTDPWGRPILTHVSWDLLWVFLFAGVVFVLAHASYARFAAHRKGEVAVTGPLNDARPDLPERIQRHSVPARLFHWVMAASMMALLLTAFLPVIGIKFSWVVWHWIAGLVLAASILFHIVHASFWMDFWSIWVGPKDVGELKAELMGALGRDVPVLKSGKYPLGNRLYHLITVVAALVTVATGLFMMVRVRTPFLTRNPYLFGDMTWGVVYVGHGIGAVGLVGLVIAHVYFAVRPEKVWVTKAMLRGWITRRQYLEHHDANRWVIGHKPVV